MWIINIVLLCVRSCSYRGFCVYRWVLYRHFVERLKIFRRYKKKIFLEKIMLMKRGFSFELKKRLDR